MVQFKQLRPDTFAVVANSRQELARIFVRLQAAVDYRTPDALPFSLDDFKTWYSRGGTFTYYNDFKGFNIPSTVVERFYAGEFNPLSGNEQMLLNSIANTEHPLPYYVVGYVDGDSDTLAHELFHALYFLNSDYRTAQDNLMAAFLKVNPASATAAFNAFLDKYKYSASIKDEERGAYMIADKVALQKAGLWTDIVQSYSDKMKKLFNSYAA